MSAGHPLGASPPGNPLPEPPPDRILDEGRIFNFAKTERTRIARLLQSTREQHGIDAYLAATSYLVNQTIEEYAQALQKEWADESRGVIICYVTGNDQMTFAVSDDFKEIIPKFELVELFNGAAVLAKQHDAPAKRLETATTWLLDGLSRKLTASERMDSLFHKDVLLLAGVLLGAILVITVFGALLAHAQKRADTRDSEFYYFPPVVVPRRFGGSFAGGAHSGIRYSQNPASGQGRPGQRPSEN